MTLLLCGRSVASVLLCSVLLVPALAQAPKHMPAEPQANDVSFSAVVETIEFKGVSPELQKVVLDRIGVRQGDRLTVDARHRIGRELGKVQSGLTFTYKAGSRPATAKLIISADC